MTFFLNILAFCTSIGTAAVRVSIDKSKSALQSDASLGSWPCRIKDDQGVHDAWVIIKNGGGDADDYVAACPGHCKGACTHLEWDKLPAPEESTAQPASNSSSKCCCKQSSCQKREDGIIRNMHRVAWQEANESVASLVKPRWTDIFLPFGMVQRAWEAQNLFNYHIEQGPLCCKEVKKCDNYFGYPKPVTQDFCAAPPDDRTDSWYALGDECIFRPQKVPTVFFKSMAEWDGLLAFRKQTVSKNSICTKDYHIKCLDRKIDNATGEVTDEGYIATVVSGSCVDKRTGKPKDKEVNGKSVRYHGAASNGFHDSTKICTGDDRMAIALEYPEPALPSKDRWPNTATMKEHWITQAGVCLKAKPVSPKSGIELSDVTEEMLTAISRSFLEMVFVSGYVPACMCCKEKLSFLTKIINAKAWMTQNCKLAYALGALKSDQRAEGGVSDEDGTEGDPDTTYDPKETAKVIAAGGVAAADKYASVLASSLVPVIGGTLVKWAKHYICQASCEMRQSPQFDPYKVALLRSIPGRAAMTWTIPVPR